LCLFVTFKNEIFTLIANNNEISNKITNLFTQRSSEISKIKLESLDKKVEEILALHEETNQIKIKLLKTISKLETIEEAVDNLLSEKYVHTKNAIDGPLIPLDKLLEENN